MKKLNVKLKNCYWIKSMDYTFDFGKSNVYLIYAPNWTMKTSFLKTLRDVSEGRKPKDVIYKIEWEATILEDSMPFENINRIRPIKTIDLWFEPKEVSSLIVSNDKEEYDKIFAWIAKAKSSIIRKLNRLSKVPQAELEKTILKDFNINSWNFIEAIKLLIQDLNSSEGLENIEYKSIFLEDKVLGLLKNPWIVKNIEAYDKKFNEILNEYKYFKKWAFTPYKAKVLIKAIQNQSFFSVEGNWVVLSNKDSPITEIKEFQKEIDQTLERIEKDAELKEIQQKILKRTKPIQAFQDLMETQWNKIIPQLKDLSNFRKKLWNSYFFQLKEDIIELVTLYESWLSEMKRIQTQANLEKTKRKSIVKEFESRFYVPFKVDIKDSVNVILGTKEPEIVFKYYNPKTKKYDISHDKKSLLGLDVLSGWEQRALYLLSILFEYNTRKLAGQEHLLIIDDIADSFDYKNKYAIIEYLQEISEEQKFSMIILTHNFDFYRSVQMRLNVPSWEKWNKNWKGANLAVSASEWNIKLTSWSEYLFPIEYFKSKYETCEYKLISLIPVARNIIEYTYWINDIEDDWSVFNYYKDLSSAVHIKTQKLKVKELFEIYSIVFDRDFENEDERIVTELIEKLCKEIVKEEATEELNLEKKIVLSIWIRLKAEEFMQSKLECNNEIDWAQTRWLFNQCVENNRLDPSVNFIDWEEIQEEKVLKEVLLMTPEAIHVNSFMFEPILDLSCAHLIKLYNKLIQLQK